MTYYLNSQDNRVYDFSHTPRGDYWQPLSHAAGKRAEQAQALESLKNIFESSDDKRVYTILRHVSSSGMSRRIDLYVIRDNKPQFLTGWASHALGYKHHERGGLVVGGCGMDMGFHVVYSLSSKLYGGDGYVLRHEWL